MEIEDLHIGDKVYYFPHSENPVEGWSVGDECEICEMLTKGEGLMVKVYNTDTRASKIFRLEIFSSDFERESRVPTHRVHVEEDEDGYTKITEVVEGKKKDPIDPTHPDHYDDFKIEPIEYIMANKLDFNEGCVVKYVTRHRKKDGAKDIKKAIKYLKYILKYDYGENIKL